MAVDLALAYLATARGWPTLPNRDLDPGADRDGRADSTGRTGGWRRKPW